MATILEREAAARRKRAGKTAWAGAPGGPPYPGEPGIAARGRASWPRRGYQIPGPYGVTGTGRGQQIYGYSGGRPLYTPTAQWRREQEEREKPRFGEYPTLTRPQQTILSGLMREPEAPAPYAPIGLPGAGERGAALSRMMGVSPAEEEAAIQRMAQPAMRQFRQEVLPGIRGTHAGAGTMWSTMRAGEEARAGAGLSERLAGMGEQYRMGRRGQAMQAAGIGLQEAMGGAQLGMQQYGMGLQAQQRRQAMLAQLLGIPMMGVYSY